MWAYQMFSVDCTKKRRFSNVGNIPRSYSYHIIVWEFASPLQGYAGGSEVLVGPSLSERPRGRHVSDERET
jgi:hypothetical protein